MEVYLLQLHVGDSSQVQNAEADEIQHGEAETVFTPGVGTHSSNPASEEKPSSQNGGNQQVHH